MSTYENCYKILESVRYGINEYSTGYVQGTDTTCPHSNSYLVDKINTAQRFIYTLLFPRIPGQFLTETSLTGSDSVFTLPWDFGRLRWFKDDYGNQVYPIDVDRLHYSGATGYDRLYYRKGNTLVLDKDGVSDTYTLYYYKKPRDLDQGKASDGGTNSITLASTGKKIDDYYNNMTIENITQDWTDTISDYTGSTRVATLAANDGAADDYYGIVSDLPEMFHFLIAPKAVHLVKAESPITKEKPKKTELDEWNTQSVCRQCS